MELDNIGLGRWWVRLGLSRASLT